MKKVTKRKAPRPDTAKEPAKLRRMEDEDIDLSDIPEITDWSKAVVGKFYRPKGGVRGKYYQQAVAGTNSVLIEPDLFEVFPSQELVNRALRLLVSTAEAATTSSRRSVATSKASKRTAAKRGRG